MPLSFPRLVPRGEHINSPTRVVGPATVVRRVESPGERYALGQQAALKGRPQVPLPVNFCRHPALIKAEGCEGSRRLSDVPLDGMQT